MQVDPRVRGALHRLQAFLAPAVDRLHAWARVLFLCRASLLVAAAVGVLLVWVDQGQEILRFAAESLPGEPRPVLTYVLLLPLYGAALWYFARVILYMRFPVMPWDASNPPPHAQAAVRWAPRLIGFAGVALISVGWMRASAVYLPENGNALVAWTLVVAGAFPIARALVVRARRISTTSATRLTLAFLAVAGASAWYVARGMPAQALPMVAMGIVTLLVAVLLWFGFVRRRTALRRLGMRVGSTHDSYGSLRTLPPATKTALLVVLGVSIVSVFVFGEAPEVLAPVLGSAGILILWGTLLTPGATLVAYLGGVLRIPAFLVLFALAALFSLSNDNHAVRTVNATSQDALPQPSLLKDFRAWVKAGNVDGDPRRARPVFLVAAEGGGIRAAYWSGMVLGEIQDRDARFAGHVYALSSVSGGSLGAITFIGAVAGGADSAACTSDSWLPVPGPHRCVIEETLGRDFLSPLIAAGLFPDLVQRLLPFPIEAWSRARALEASWEREWMAVGGDASFTSTLPDLHERLPAAPRPFLNATVAEIGQRIVASPVSLDFDHTLALRGELIAEVRASTAASLSARFPYVTPAALLERRSGGRLRIIDGGYFENSGTETLSDILRIITPAIEEWNATNRGPLLFPVVIVIRNDPKVLGRRPERPDTTFLSELLTPVRGLFRTREARATLARARLQRTVEAFCAETSGRCDVPEAARGRYLEFNLFARGVDLPLGWTLSRDARAEMRCQLLMKSGACPKFGNPSRLELIPTNSYLIQALALVEGRPRQIPAMPMGKR